MAAAPERFFPADYRSARRAFIAACEARGLDAIARVVPGVSGPDGKPLFMDSVALGPRDATRALLVIGGAHGVDGYFGSAVQTGLLREGIAPPAGARLVMIHALNPYGFAWDRRENEDNIDIDRGFIGQGAAAPCWSARALEAVLTEDLSRVQRLAVIDCRTGPAMPGSLDRGLRRLMPGADVTYEVVAMDTVPPDRFASDDARALREARFIDTPAWKDAAWNFGRDAVMTALAALA